MDTKEEQMKNKLLFLKTQSKKDKIFTIMSWAIFAFAFIFLCVFLIVKIDFYLDSDMSSEMILADLLKEENGLIISKNWFYSTEIRVIYIQLIFKLLFSITQNWHIVRVISSICLYILMLFSLYFFCYQAGIKKYFPCIATILILPTHNDYFYSVILGLYYITYLITLFVLFGCVFLFLKQNKKLKKIFCLIVVAIISLFTTLGGPRLIMTFYAPIAIMAFVCLLYYRKSEYKDIYNKFFIIAFVLGLSALIGYIVNIFYLHNNYSFLSQESQIDMSPNFLNLGLSVWNFGLMFGLNADISILSVPSYILAVLLLTIFIIATINILRKNTYSRNEKILTQYCLFACLVFSIISLFYNQFIHGRFNVPIYIFMVPVIFIFFKQEKFKINKIIIPLTIVLFAFNVSLNYVRYWQKSPNIEKISITKLLIDKEYYNGYAAFWNGNVLTELSDGQIEVWVYEDINGFSNGDNVEKWLQNKEHLEKFPEGKVFLLYSMEEFNNLNNKDILSKQIVLYQSESYIVYGFSSYNEFKMLF